MFQNVFVNSREELDQQTNQYLLMKYKISEANNNYRVLKKNKNGNIGIHILLYICGWIFYVVCAYWSYVSALNSYYYDYSYSYGPNILLVIILILAIFGFLNIIYLFYSRNNCDTIKIQIRNTPKVNPNPVKTNPNTIVKNTPRTGLKQNKGANFCPNCGEELKETDKFCNNCGNIIKK